MPRLKEYQDHSCDYDSSKTELFTTEELAHKIKIAPTQLYQLRTRGGGPKFFKITDGKSAKILYDWKDVLVFLESRKRTSTSDTGGN
jgi:hypothetical protein